MKPQLYFVAVMLLVFTSLAFPQEPSHPTLFFNQQEGIEIRNRILDSGSVENQFFLQIKKVADFFVVEPWRMLVPMNHPTYPAGVAMQFNLYSLALTYFVTKNAVYLQTGFAWKAGAKNSKVSIELIAEANKQFVFQADTVPDFYPYPNDSLAFSRTKVAVDGSRASLTIPLTAYEKVSGPFTMHGVLVYQFAGRRTSAVG